METLREPEEKMRKVVKEKEEEEGEEMGDTLLMFRPKNILSFFYQATNP